MEGSGENQSFWEYVTNKIRGWCTVTNCLIAVEYLLLAWMLIDTLSFFGRYSFSFWICYLLGCLIWKLISDKYHKYELYELCWNNDDPETSDEDESETESEQYASQDQFEQSHATVRENSV